jgi:hypothetical protein
MELIAKPSDSVTFPLPSIDVDVWRHQRDHVPEPGRLSTPARLRDRRAREITMIEVASRRRQSLPSRSRAAIAASAVVAVVAGGLAGAPAAPAAAGTLASTPNYSLSLALQESLYFYDAEKAGASRSLGRQPLEWRGDADPTDAKVPLKPIKNWEGTNLTQSFIDKNKKILDPDGDGTVDLSGGFHDAGDHVKFGLPQAYAAGTIGWGMYEFKDAFVATGTWEHALEEMRWFTDYFLRSAFFDASGNIIAFNYQVGDGSVDHAYWGPPELQSEKLYPRPAYFATPDNPASDQTASHAAALAIMAMLVSDTDAAYSKRCLDTAEALYDFSLKNRGLGYSGGFYGSAFETDEMSWGAVWLYLATQNRDYLEDIISVDSKGAYDGYLKDLVGNATNTWQNIWVHSWEAKWGGVFSMLDWVINADTSWPEKTRTDMHYFNKWHTEYWSQVAHDDPNNTTFLATSPGGFAFLNGWGSARYNTAAQLEALAYRRHFPNDPKSVKFTDWAMGQMNYIMGDNPLNRSYIVGFGSTTPGVGDLVGGTAVAALHPHHAAAHGSTTNNQDEPSTHRHMLWGALVGGPDLKDEHADLTTDYVYNEVAVDYNGALVGALAGLWKYYGASQKMTNFTPPLEPETTDYYAYGESMQLTEHSNQVTVTVNNFASRPPHYQTDLTSRYFFDISEIYKRGQDIGAVTPAIYYDASAASYNQPAKLTGPTRWGGPNSCVYYVTIDWNGVDIFGARQFQFGLNEAQTADYKTYWDPSNDPSYAGLADKKYVKTPDPYIPVYSGGTLLHGQEPSTTLNESCVPDDPGSEPGPEEALLTAQYVNTSASAAGAQIANRLQLTNTGTSAVPLSAVTVRYWFTAETTGGMTYACDYWPQGCANVKATFKPVEPAVEGADRYLELSFTSGAGKLTAGASTGQLQNRMFRSDYGSLDQSDDYSYGATTTALADWNRVTVYYNGNLIFGTEPR